MTAAAAPRSPRLLAATVGALGARVLLLGLSLGQGVLLTRGLGPEGLGRYSAVLIDINLLVALLSFGLPGALAVLVGESAGGASRLAQLRALGRQHGLALLALLAVGASATALGLSLPGRTSAWSLLIALGILIQYSRDVQNSLLWGAQRFAVQNRLSLLVQLVLASALLVHVLLGRLSPMQAVALQLAANLLWTLGALLWPRPDAIPAPDPSAPVASELSPLRRTAWRIGLRNYLSQLLDLLLLRIDVYLIQHLTPAATMERDLGIYQAAVRVAELLLMVPSTLNAVLFAKAAAREDVALMALRSAKLALWIGLFGLAAMALIGQPLLVLFFGSRFAGSFAPCLWVLSGCVAWCFSGPLAGTLQGAAGYPRSVMLAQATALLSNVLANLYLLPRYGVVGAAAATTLAYLVSAAFISLAFVRRFDLSLGQLLRPESPWTLWRALRNS